MSDIILGDITRPGSYSHTNADKAFTDSSAVRGGGRVTSNLTTLLTDFIGKEDQLKNRVTLVWVTSENKFYQLKDKTQIGSLSNGWVAFETGGGGSSDLELGETNDTAYRGDRGKIAYEHSQTNGNPHATTKSDIGLGDVDNVSDINKPISTAQANAFDLKADKINPVFTGVLAVGDVYKLYAGSATGISNCTTYLGFNAVRDEEAGIWTIFGDFVGSNGGNIILSDIDGDLRKVSIMSTGSTNQTKTDAEIAALLVEFGASVSTEDVQDIAGSMIATGTHSGISVTYDDTTGVVNLTVPVPTIADGSITAAKLDNSLQSKVSKGNQSELVIELSADIDTNSGWVKAPKGTVSTISLSIGNKTDGSTTNFAPSGTYVYTVEVKPNNSTTLTGTATLNSSSLTTLQGYMQTASSGSADYMIKVSVAGLPAGAMIDFGLLINHYA